MKRLKLAILDLYDGEPNMGMGAIKDIVRRYEADFDWEVFDVRGKAEVPDLSFDMFISSGGPGSPLEGNGVWEVNFYKWMDEVWNWNSRPGKYPKKYVFFICHSFQMACHHFKLATVNKRKSRSFGTFPAFKTSAGMEDPFFQPLSDPFYVADFRDFQVVKPDHVRFKLLGASILLKEKIRPHIDLERAIMAIRFSKEIFGTQFHPEAYPDGMLEKFTDPEKKAAIIKEHGEGKYDQMIFDLENPDKILLTYQTILPSFLENAIQALKPMHVSL